MFLHIFLLERPLNKRSDKTIAVPEEVQQILKDAKEKDGLSRKTIISAGVKTINEYFLQNKAPFRPTSEAVSSRELLLALREKARKDGASFDELAEIDKGIKFFESVLQRLRDGGEP
jgi:hypothetical protein